MAQPVITTNNIPQLGDAVTIGLCSDIVDADALNTSAGAIQTWDFSGLTETEEQMFTFVDPATTFWANDYPGANLCGVSWTGSHSYYHVGSGALETSGNAQIVPGTAPEDTIKMIYSTDIERIVPLPYTYLDQSTDNFAGSFSFGALVGTMDGNISFEADGYGTLILPNGTYENVVRYHFNRTQNNTLITTTTTTKEQWAWVSEDHRFWLLLMEINFDGFATSDLVWYDKSPLPAVVSSVQEREALAWSIHPNPASIGTSVLLQSDVPVGHRLLDASGRLVRSYPVGTLQLDTDGLAAGSYLLERTDREGLSLGTTQLILQ
jgi:hypothetical protein